MDELLPAGHVRWHSTGPDEGPDVGIEIGLPDGSTLWVGEISRALHEDADGKQIGSDCGWWLVHYADDKRGHVIGKALPSWAGEGGTDFLAAALRTRHPEPAATDERVEKVEKVARVVRDASGCGLTVAGERVFCDDPRSEHATTCDCRGVARAVLAALKAEPAHDEITIGTRCARCGTTAPEAFAAQCNRPECEYRKPAHDDGLVERLREMAPADGTTIRCKDRTTREMNSDIREAATRIKALKAALVEAREALKLAGQFIENGIEAGFIRMPGELTPDPAHDTLPTIKTVLRSLSEGE